jgi:hypothetical protein
MIDNNITARLRAWSADESTWDLLTEGVREIDRLRAALQAIAQCPIPARLPGRVELWSLAVQMQETAIAALREASDDAAT